MDMAAQKDVRTSRLHAANSGIQAATTSVPFDCPVVESVVTPNFKGFRHTSGCTRVQSGCNAFERLCSLSGGWPPGWMYHNAWHVSNCKGSCIFLQYFLQHMTMSKSIKEHGIACIKELCKAKSKAALSSTYCSTGDALQLFTFSSVCVLFWFSLYPLSQYIKGRGLWH